MSYCRFGENGSDVYMYTDGTHWHILCEDDWMVDSLQEAKEILLSLRQEGNHIPDGVFVRVQAELTDFEAARKERDEQFMQRVIENERRKW